MLDARVPPPADGDPGRLVEAMRYSLLAPGKRHPPAARARGGRDASRPLDDDVAPRLLPRRARPLLLAHPRRPAGDGRRRLPPRPSEQPQGLRRGDRHPGRRRAPDAGVRLDRRGGRARRAGRRRYLRGRARARARRRRARDGARTGARSAASRPRRRSTRSSSCTPRRPPRSSGRRSRSARRRRRGARGGRGPRGASATASASPSSTPTICDDAEHPAHAAAARARLEALVDEACAAVAPLGAAGARLVDFARALLRQAALLRAMTAPQRPLDFRRGCVNMVQGDAAGRREHEDVRGAAGARGRQAGPRLSRRPGRRERRRDVQDRGRQDGHRPRPEGADPPARRRHLARARAARHRGERDRPAGSRVDERHLLQRAQGRAPASSSTATRSWSARRRS